jgi:hypothetical protein
MAGLLQQDLSSFITTFSAFSKQFLVQYVHGPIFSALYALPLRQKRPFIKYKTCFSCNLVSVVKNLHSCKASITSTHVRRNQNTTNHCVSKCNGYRQRTLQPQEPFFFNRKNSRKIPCKKKRSSNFSVSLPLLFFYITISCSKFRVAISHS